MILLPCSATSIYIDASLMITVSRAVCACLILSIAAVNFMLWKPAHLGKTTALKFNVILM
jgi:hypothetical protein